MPQIGQFQKHFKEKSFEISNIHFWGGLNVNLTRGRFTYSQLDKTAGPYSVDSEKLLPHLPIKTTDDARAQGRGKTNSPFSWSVLP